MRESNSGAVVVAHDDKICEVLINRPEKRNALSHQLLLEITAAVQYAEASGYRVLILRGEGGYFSAGADVMEMQGTSVDSAWFDCLRDLVTALSSSSLVTIAAIERGCMGAAIEIAAACDLRVGDESTVFALPSIAMGIVYPPESLARVMAIIGPGSLARLVLINQVLTASEAYAHGLITSLASRTAFEDAFEIATRLVQLPPQALIQTTRLLSSMLDGTAEVDEWYGVYLASLQTIERRDAVCRRQQAREESRHAH